MVVRRRSAVAGGLETFIGLVVLSVGFLAALGTVLGFLGSFWWAFDVLSSFRFQYAIVLLLTAAVYGFGFGRGSAAVFLAAALVNVALLVPFFIGDPPARDESVDDELRLVSFNVGVSNPQRQRILDWVAESGADFVFLLEASSDWDQPIANAGLPYRVLAEPPPDRQFGIIMLGNGSIDVDILRLGDTREPVISFETVIDDEEVRVLVVHPRSPSDETRAAIRNDTLDAVAEVAAQSEIPVVVIGDLNATQWSAAFRNLQRRGDLRDSARGFGWQPTWPDLPFPARIPIDHMLHTEELATLARGVGPDLGSDHRPLLATVGIAER